MLCALKEQSLDNFKSCSRVYRAFAYFPLLRRIHIVPRQSSNTILLVSFHFCLYLFGANKGTAPDSTDIPTYTLVAQLKRLARDLLSFLASASATSSPPATSSLASNTRAIRRLEAVVNRSGYQDAGKVADLLVFTLDVPVEQKIAVLAARSQVELLSKAVELLSQQINVSLQ